MSKFELWNRKKNKKVTTEEMKSIIGNLLYGKKKNNLSNFELRRKDA